MGRRENVALEKVEYLPTLTLRGMASFTRRSNGTITFINVSVAAATFAEMSPKEALIFEGTNEKFFPFMMSVSSQVAT